MDCGHKEITFICFEKKSLIKGQLPVYFTRQQFLKRFSELMKSISDVPETFCFKLGGIHKLRLQDEVGRWLSKCQQMLTKVGRWSVICKR